jgi:hypothetical protein
MGSLGNQLVDSKQEGLSLAAMSQRVGHHEAQGGRDGAPARHLAGNASIDLRACASVKEVDVCRKIDDLLARLSSLAASDLSPVQFLDQMLVQAIREAGALAGAVWAGRDRLLERFAEGHGALITAATRDGGRMDLLERAVAGMSDSAIVEQIDSGGSAGPLVSVVAPFTLDEHARGAIELLLSGDRPSSMQDRARRLAEAFAEIVGDYYCRRQVAGYRQREIHWQSLSRFLEAIHRPGLRETAIAIVNEGRWFSQCDRVSVICNQMGRCKVLAVSGVDRIESRSNLVAGIEELADAVLKTGEALWVLGQLPLRAPDIETALDNYLEQSHSRAVVALPLASKPTGELHGDLCVPNEDDAHPQGVLVLEWFATPVIDEAARERIELVARHSAAALAVALSTERLPLIGFNRALAKVAWLARARQLPRTLLVAGIFVAILSALVVVPTDFEIAADGELMPSERREIFAPSDAVVDRVLVEHGDDVAAGQPLLQLRSAALDFESARLRGEIQTAEKRLAAIRSARFERDTDRSAPADRRLALTAEEEELKASLAGLRRQEQLLSQERDLLEVRSPLKGRVLTWDVARSLAARPVERGQSLLSVGDVEGRWSLELCVPDEQIGYVLTAAEQARLDDVPLPVSFLLVGEPGLTYRGYVDRIARRGHVDEKSGKPVVQVVVRLDEAIESPRPRAGVVANIYCGRRSLGFVWLHDAWNSIRRRLLF